MVIKDYEDFKAVIHDMSGINLSFYKERQMKRRIDSLIRKNNFNSYHDYVMALKANSKLYQEFINYLTINVSEFYRNPAQWEILNNKILPMLFEKSKSLKIWSAACSTGEEPYTLAMVLNNYLPLRSIKILATDIDSEALEKAKIGLYNRKSVENVPPKNIIKYFSREGNFYRIKDELKNCIEFKKHNLLKDPYPSDCDLIICRNVLIYFTEEAKVDIYKKFNKALKNERILFVGSTEQIIMSYKYNLSPIETFFYQKRGDL